MDIVKSAVSEVNPYGAVSILPTQKDRNQSLVCRGVTAETLSMANREPFESHYCGPLHLLIAHERLARRSGVTKLEGLPDSEVENLSHTLTFVPAGRKFREWHDPDIPSRITYILIDPRGTSMAGQLRIACRPLAARLHFQNLAVWQTVAKLRAVAEEGEDCSPYGDSLAVVLAHELVRLDGQASAAAPTRTGCLTVWQRRLVSQFIDEHLEETLTVVRLATLARLSAGHFCRHFKISFGVPPHKYILNRRIERAKLLLAVPGKSVTDIAPDIGFSETSSFTTVFRRLVGHTSTAYRRHFVSTPT